MRCLNTPNPQAYLALEKREKYAQMGFLFTKLKIQLCYITVSSCGLELHITINNYITVRGTQMVKLDHEYDYKPVLLFKFENHRSWTSFAASHGTKKVLSVEMSTTLTVKVHNDRFDDDFWMNYVCCTQNGKGFHKIASSALHNIQESDCTGFNQPTGTQSYLLSAAMRTSEEELFSGFDKDI